MTSNKKKRFNPFVWLINYFKEAREEMRKVTWPSKQDTFRYSLVVIILCLVLAIFFAGLDFLLSLGLSKLIVLTKK